MLGKNDWVKLIIPCQPKYVSVVRLTLAAVAARTELTVDDIDDVKVAVSEACTNVIDHAYCGRDQSDESAPIEIVFYPQPDQLQVEVSDEGVGFDPKRLQLPDDRLLDRQGGLGIYLIKRLMDRAEIQSAPGSGTKVTMVKHASR